MLNFALLCKIYNVDAETSQKLSSWSRTSRSPEATSRFVTLLPSAAGTTTVAEMIAAETTVAETTVAGTIDARMAASDRGLAKACEAGAVRGPDVRSRGHGATSDAADDREGDRQDMRQFGADPRKQRGQSRPPGPKRGPRCLICNEDHPTVTCPRRNRSGNGASGSGQPACGGYISHYGSFVDTVNLEPQDAVIAPLEPLDKDSPDGRSFARSPTENTGWLDAIDDARLCSRAGSWSLRALRSQVDARVRCNTVWPRPTSVSRCALAS